jgi:hypothetical protein
MQAGISLIGFVSFSCGLPHLLNHTEIHSCVNQGVPHYGALMMKAMIKHVASATGLSPKRAENALGIVLNASERQGSVFVAQLYKKLPGAKALSAKAGKASGAATGELARLIEQTPGGRMAVATGMIRNLQKAGLGHNEISGIFPAVSSYCEEAFGLKGFGHLGDLLGTRGADAATDTAVA